jgi:hypothetical protein
MAAKQVELALSLSQSLTRRGFVCVNGFDTNGLPTIALGTQSAGQQAAFIRVEAVPSIGTDSLGLTQRAFGPHVIQVVLETSSVANVALLLESNKLPIMGEILGRGTRVELYLSSNGTAVAIGQIVSANLKATWDGFNLEFGVMAAV